MKTLLPGPTLAQREWFAAVSDWSDLLDFNLQNEPYRSASLKRQTLLRGIERALNARQQADRLTIAYVDISSGWSPDSVSELEDALAAADEVSFLAAIALTDLRIATVPDELNFNCETRVRGVLYGEKRGSTLTAARKLKKSTGPNRNDNVAKMVGGRDELAACLQYMLMSPQTQLLVSDDEASSWSREMRESREREMDDVIGTHFFALAEVDPADTVFGFNLEPDLTDLLRPNVTKH